MSMAELPTMKDMFIVILEFGIMVYILTTL